VNCTFFFFGSPPGAVGAAFLALALFSLLGCEWTRRHIFGEF